MLMYLQRKIKLGNAFPIIETNALKMPLLSIREQYETFSEEYPEYKMSFSTYQKYFSRIDAKKMKKRYDELISTKECSLDKGRFLEEILAEEDISHKTRKKIVSIFPEAQRDEKEMKNEIAFTKKWDLYAKLLLIRFLVASNMSFDSISTLFSVSKTSIHNWFYKLSFLKTQILRAIQWWSGIISVDEKWIKVNGKWKYLLSIVDNKTGFLLYYMIASDLKADNWKIFFQRFYRLYGAPKLIISDGSGSLASGRKAVFPDVPHQLCKFHKLKNLIRQIHSNYGSSKKYKKMIRLATNIFSNKTSFARKRAAKRLMEIAPHKVAKYVEKNILGNWKYLRKSLTSNSVERVNRKYEKVTAKRYGLKSVEFVDQLIASLWLKEAIRDKRHFDKSFIRQINLHTICQGHLKMSNIVKVIPDKLLKRIA